MADAGFLDRGGAVWIGVRWHSRLWMGKNGLPAYLGRGGGADPCGVGWGYIGLSDDRKYSKAEA